MSFLARKSLQVQLIALGAIAVLFMSTAAGIVIAGTWMSGARSSIALETVALRFITTVILAGLASVVLVALGVRRLLSPLQRLRDAMHLAAEGRLDPLAVVAPRSEDLAGVKSAFDELLDRFHRTQQEHEESKRVLGARTRTVDQLLEFSQTLQGAGRAEQIFATLAHYLRTELGLSGLVILAHDPESVPATQVKAQWPDDVLSATCPASEMDTSLCPCLRQNLPKQFRCDGAPVRCSVDASLRLGADHAAYCIPFTLGRKHQVLVHMLLAPGVAWTEEQRQLAQTYVNTANSSLISLHMLAEAEKQSMTDPLTGLFNRRSMEQLLSREVALSERHGHPLSVVMIDMDKFKDVNDTHGHAAGDHMLRAFADCVRITLRKTDLAFRFGGDEFVIALPQTAIAQAQQVVAKLRQAYAAVDFSSAIANLELQPTLSIGVAERSKASGVLTLQQLLQCADSALYAAKSDDRNCIRTYQPIAA